MQKTINGLQFEISEPYAEGHTVTDLEARVLNQTRSENIGNNARAKIKEMQEANNSEDEIAEYVAGIDRDYTFTVRGVSAARKLDPVEREARKLARELLKSYLAESGRKITVAPEGMTEEEWDEKVEAELDRISADEQILSVAKKNVAAKTKQAEQLASVLQGATV